MRSLASPELAPQEIAEYFNVSLRQLYRISALSGCTPAALIWRRRLERAKSLLQDPASRAPITEIALSCGFKDGAHFSRSIARFWRSSACGSPQPGDSYRAAHGGYCFRALSRSRVNKKLARGDKYLPSLARYRRWRCLEVFYPDGYTERCSVTVLRMMR